MFKLPWNLSYLKDVPKNGLKVFSCFHCGGGSSMGYKLAGYDVLGGVEIDPEMMLLYKTNHNPKHSFLMPIQEFNKIPNDKLPEELFNLDILDGSPPCSSFSMAGSREKKWGKKGYFKEGQAEQVLDDLFFHFIETARKLQPKVVVAENVKGLVMGNAKGYVKQIKEMFNHAGYDLQLFLLNAAFMGVPQRRERVFFVAQKKDSFKPIQLKFNEKTIKISDVISDDEAIGKLENRDTKCFKYWQKCGLGKSFASVHETRSYFSKIKINPNAPSPTITGHASEDLFHWRDCAKLSEKFFIKIQSFPDDYNFCGKDVGYFCGMSVPPIMMANIGTQIKLQIFDKNYEI